MALPLPSNLGALWHVLLHLVVFFADVWFKVQCSEMCSGTIAEQYAVESLQCNQLFHLCSGGLLLLLQSKRLQWGEVKTQCIRDATPQKRDFWGIFPKGGRRIVPILKTFVFKKMPLKHPILTKKHPKFCKKTLFFCFWNEGFPKGRGRGASDISEKNPFFGGWRPLFK